MVLVIDNYDSFTYNLVQYLGELGADIRVRRNNQVTLDEIGAMAPDAHRDLARARPARGCRRLAGRHPAVRRRRRRCWACASATRRSAWSTAAP